MNLDQLYDAILDVQERFDDGAPGAREELAALLDQFFTQQAESQCFA